MNTSFINPSVTFYRTYENNIKNVRESLFVELEGLSSDFSIEARKILDEKLQSNQNNPLFGELFPWIIKDLTNADSETTHRISIGWLALYLYTLFLDEYVDDPKLIEPKKFITGAVLAKTGFLKISHFTNNTPYEKYIDQALSLSVLNQNLDTQFQKQITKINIKAEYSEGKNYVVLACAGALAAVHSKYAEFITKFTESLLLTLQYLDDIADFKEDFKADNITVLLNEAFKSNPKLQAKLKNTKNRELLKELILTNALQRVVDKIQVLLNQSIILIQENKLIKQTNKPSVDYFLTLQTSIASFNKFLKKDAIHFKGYSQDQQDIIIDKSEKFIKLIAQST